jgi:hypothetical protein
MINAADPVLVDRQGSDTASAQYNVQTSDKDRRTVRIVHCERSQRVVVVAQRKSDGHVLIELGKLEARRGDVAGTLGCASEHARD